MVKHVADAFGCHYGMPGLSTAVETHHESVRSAQVVGNEPFALVSELRSDDNRHVLLHSVTSPVLEDLGDLLSAAVALPTTIAVEPSQLLTTESCEAPSVI